MGEADLEEVFEFFDEVAVMSAWRHLGKERQRGKREGQNQQPKDPNEFRPVRRRWLGVY